MVKKKANEKDSNSEAGDGGEEDSLEPPML